MYSKFLVPIAMVATLGAPAVADSADPANDTSQVLAWTVAAYASCETMDELQADYREEVARIEADITDVLESLRILSVSDNICGNLNTYANEMLVLAEYDLPAVEARLITFEEPELPYFEVEVPEGAGAQHSENSLIITEAGELPPLSGPMPPSSDYQE